MIEEIKDRFRALPKPSQNNIIVMVILLVMFLIGIIIRWDYISEELGSVKNRYVEIFSPVDSTSIKQ